MMGWYGNGGWGLGMILMGLFWVIVVAAAVWAVARWTRQPQEPHSHPAESARAILDRRFAAGEIDAEQYGRDRRVLDGRGMDDDARR